MSNHAPSASVPRGGRNALGPQGGSETSRRLSRLRARLADAGLPAMAFAAPETLDSMHVRYLTGFRGSSSYLLVTGEAACLITDFRYIEVATTLGQDVGFDVLLQQGSLIETLAKAIRDAGLRTVAFEAERVPVALLQAWQTALPEVEWRDARGIVETLRCIKDPAEIAAIRRAAELSGVALEDLLPTLRGRTERSFAMDLEYRMRQLGLDGPGFSTIVAAGERGSMPHAEPSDRTIRDGDLVTVDFGGWFDGYRSDETVTLAIGPSVPDPLQRIFRIVEQAQAAGIAQVRPGILAGAVDQATRAVIEAAGYGAHFGHGTGHGVGLEIHERPFARKNVVPDEDEILLPGMTITVEPGIYVPRLGGVRLEDTLVVTGTGAQKLTTVPKSYRVV